MEVEGADADGPVKPQSAYIATPDGSLPTEYQNVLDPLDVLGYAAATTNKIALGTAVADMFFYTPIMLANLFASIMFYRKEE